MDSRLDKVFEKLINDYDEEQEDLESRHLEQWEIDLDKRIDEEYFKFIIPSILNTEQQKR